MTILIFVKQGNIQWNERYAKNLEDLKPVVGIDDGRVGHGVSIEGPCRVIYEPTGLHHGSRVWIETDSQINLIPAETVYDEFDPAELDRSRGKQVFGMHFVEDEVRIIEKALHRSGDKIILERIHRFYESEV